MTGVCQNTIVLYTCKEEINMFKKIFSNIFIKEKKASDKPLTIINENRESTALKRTALYTYKDERQKTCLSKYFANIKGLNTIERNIYSKII